MADIKQTNGHNLLVSDIFSKFDTSHLKMGKGDPNFNNKNGKAEMCNQIFSDLCQMIIDDIIDNNTHFKLPSFKKNEAYIFMHNINGQDFKDAYTKGVYRYKDIDWLTSNFNGYYLGIDVCHAYRPTREVPITVDAIREQKIVTKTNNGESW